MFDRRRGIAVLTLTMVGWGAIAAAQQRPLVTEDPEVIGAGRLLIESGIEAARGAKFPLSGLEGTLFRLPTLGISLGISSIAEFQIDGGFARLAISARSVAPLSTLVTAVGDATHDVDDTIVATKIRLLSESATRPSLAVRFATRLPNARNESGLGLDTFDTFAAVLSGKTVQSTRIVVNLGVGFLGDPTHGYHQQSALIYGVSAARALSEHSEVVIDVNGRVSPGLTPPPGTETRGRVIAGSRYLRGMFRFDVGLLIGLTTADPSVGITSGVTLAIHAFDVP